MGLLETNLLWTKLKIEAQVSDTYKAARASSLISCTSCVLQAHTATSGLENSGARTKCWMPALANPQIFLEQMALKSKRH